MITLSPKEANSGDVLFEPENTKGPFNQSLGLSAININEGEGEYVLYVAAPGMHREDFSVCIDKKTITIVASNREEASYANHRENNFSEWKRSLTLPDNADPLLTAATFNNGELEIHIPKGQNTEKDPLTLYVY